MRFYHSFWSKPMYTLWHDSKPTINSLYLTALSIHYVKKHGHEIVLHTDRDGEQVFDVLPYDNIYTTLEISQLRNQTSEIFWAAGKIYAHEVEPLGAISIDTDVLLKKANVFEVIENSSKNYDLLVQDLELDEVGQVYNHPRQAVREYVVHRYAPKEMSFGANKAYNCGVIGLFNKDLKDRYISAYKDITQRLSRSKTLYENSVQNKACLDLFLEQMWLWALTNKLGYKVKTLLNDRCTLGLNLLSNEQLGYIHYLSVYKNLFLGSIKQELTEQSPKLFEVVEQKIKKFMEDNKK